MGTHSFTSTISLRRLGSLDTFTDTHTQIPFKHGRLVFVVIDSFLRHLGAAAAAATTTIGSHLPQATVPTTVHNHRVQTMSMTQTLHCSHSHHQSQSELHLRHSDHCFLPQPIHTEIKTHTHMTQRQNYKRNHHDSMAQTKRRRHKTRSNVH